MDNELLDGLAGEVARQFTRMRAELRREMAAQLADQVATVHRAAALREAALRERLGELMHGLELAQRELAELRAVAGDPVAAFSRDADGGVSLIQRNGPARVLPLPDVRALVHAEVESLGGVLRETLQVEVARAIERFINA